ncbi:MAG TPA: cytochrome c [Flammeovirgaceae bacterium]|nr:cytochrome c [Flammeovirgaceae bacterium]
MKRIKTILIFVLPLAVGLFLAGSCASARVSMKTGAQLWGENCMRCHNTPSPAAYNNVDWATIGLHMRVRANLTAEETRKVVEFLQSAN